MMFSSNQLLVVTGCIEHHDELKTALKFALELSGEMECFTRAKNPGKCVYQITEDGRYCVGWAFNEIKRGWNEYPFDFDLDIISQIIKKHLEKQTVQRDMWDGSYHKGFYMKAIPHSFSDEDGIQEPFYGIVEFRPYTCFYAK